MHQLTSTSGQIHIHANPTNETDDPNLHPCGTALPSAEQKKMDRNTQSTAAFVKKCQLTLRRQFTNDPTLHTRPAGTAPKQLAAADKLETAHNAAAAAVAASPSSLQI